MDPANIDLLRDFYADRSQTRLLEIECDFTDQYLVGHARRVGLAGERTSQDTIERLLPTIRNDVIFESDRLRDEQFPNHFRMRQAAPPEENAPALAEFFTLPEDRALEIARTDFLFKD
jgi:hypothetical protein